MIVLAIPERAMTAASDAFLAADYADVFTTAETIKAAVMAAAPHIVAEKLRDLAPYLCATDGNFLIKVADELNGAAS